MQSYYYRQAASLREEQASSEGVTASRCVGPHPQGRAWTVLGLVAGGCPEPQGVSTRNALNAKRSLIQGELVPTGHCWGTELH